MDVEQEISELKRRVGDLEGAVNVLTGQLSRVQPALQALTEATTLHFGRADECFKRMTTRLDRIDTHVWSLRDDLPEMLREALTAHHGGRSDS